MPPIGTLCTTVDERGVEYRYRVIAEGAAQIERCSTKAERLDIPDELDGLEVVALGESSFANLFNVRSVHCGRCLKHIGEKAFFGCSRLAELSLNDGLESVGTDAFGLCPALPCLDIPASVSALGHAAAGNAAGAYANNSTELRIAPDNEHLFVAADGCVYKRTCNGLELVDATAFKGSSLVLLDGTASIAPRACASNANLEEAVLPEGLIAIGEAAFSGCSNLRRAALPSTLEELGENAFSTTGLSELSIPASLTRFKPLSFNLGFGSKGLEANPYRSSLKRIAVDPRNPLLEARGSVLFARTAAGLEALLCTANPHEAELDTDVAYVHAHAFAGSISIGTLRLHDGLRFGSQGLLPHKSARELEIARGNGGEGSSSVKLEVPEGPAGRDFLAASLSAGSIDVELLLSNYDETVAAHGAGTLAGSRQMASRLAHPTHLSAAHKNRFMHELSSAVESVCAHFGARSYWTGFDHLVEGGVLDQDGIAEMVEVLTKLGDTSAAAYLLQLRVERYGRPVFDYGL